VHLAHLAQPQVRLHGRGRRAAELPALLVEEARAAEGEPAARPLFEGVVVRPLEQIAACQSGRTLQLTDV